MCAGLGAAAALLAGCASVPQGAVLAPNANLHVEGIPAIPMSLVEQAERYTEFRGHAFVDWHPSRREMLVSHRSAGASTAQIYRVAAPMAAPEPLTDAAEPVRTARYEPNHGRYLVFARATGGDEADQLYRLDLPSRAETRLTDPAQRHAMQGWLHRSSEMLVMSVPLDRTARGGTRERVSQTLSRVDPARPDSLRPVAELPGVGWFASGISRDDRQLVLTRYVSANESEVWLLDVDTGRLAKRLPADGETLRATHFAGDFTPDGRHLYVISDRGGEFRELMRLELASGALTPLTRHIPWDVTAVSLSEDGGRVAALANVDGRSELRLFDAADGFRELTLPAMPGGSIVKADFHRRSGELAFAVDSAQGPSQVHALDAGGRGTAQWTRAHTPTGIDTARFTDPQIVRWQSFDGRTISGLQSLPPARFEGRRPVLVRIHGGPESQARLGFLGRYNYFVNELGIAVIEPNVRGSSGYGKSFLALDNGRLREDAVKDIGALLDWIATQPRLDASRVLVSGGSYGGYMSLATSVHYAGRIAGAIDAVGISNFVSFLRNTESYRRDLRRAEYGDERDPQMREFLESISPLNHAQRITKPLLVVHGRNDPRVPYTEAEQIVAKVRGNGARVWYLRAENEGHGFARKENADFYFYTTVMFAKDVLLN